MVVLALCVVLRDGGVSLGGGVRCSVGGGLGALDRARGRAWRAAAVGLGASDRTLRRVASVGGGGALERREVALDGDAAAVVGVKVHDPSIGTLLLRNVDNHAGIGGSSDTDLGPKFSTLRSHPPTTPFD
jgi:hypothetical protein